MVSYLGTRWGEAGDLIEMRLTGGSRAAAKANVGAANENVLDSGKQRETGARNLK